MTEPEQPMSFEEFIEEIKGDLATFAINLKDDKRQLSYADWFDIFRAWAEVGTEEEERFFGPRLMDKVKYENFVQTCAAEREPPERRDVHTEHCCTLHGCKYGHKDCPVESKTKKQSYPCEWCGLEMEGYFDQ